MSLFLKCRIVTRQIADMGKASRIPKKPNNCPNSIKAKRTATGCKPIRSPTSLGVKKNPSNSCPTP